jgi:hypothetical protein
MCGNARRQGGRTEDLHNGMAGRVRKQPSRASRIQFSDRVVEGVSSAEARNEPKSQTPVTIWHQVETSRCNALNGPEHHYGVTYERFHGDGDTSETSPTWPLVCVGTHRATVWATNHKNGAQNLFNDR